MRKLAFGALFVGLMAACGGGSNSKKITFTDGGGSADSMDVCNPIMQTGCTSGQKCTWIVDQTTPSFIGHVGCAPVMAIAPDTAPAADGAACQRNPAGATGWDDCVAGDYCQAATTVEQSGGAGICKKICDLNSATSCGSAASCQGYNNLFSSDPATPPTAGVCDPTCNPFTDNNYLGSNGTKTGTTCSKTKGCYGVPTFFSSSTSPLVFTCSDEVNPTRVHRAQCTPTKQTGDQYGCLETISGKNYFYPNSCAQGYQPLITDTEGGSTLLCVAMCHAQDCYAGTGNCPNGHIGIAPNRCATTDIQIDPVNYPAFDGSAGGEACNYIWNLEINMSGTFVRSNFSDSLGLCVERDKYIIGDGMTVGSATLEPCESEPLKSGSAVMAGCTTASGCQGADGLMGNFFGWGPFACVSATKAGIMDQGKTTQLGHHFPLARLPYSTVRATF